MALDILKMIIRLFRILCVTDSSDIEHDIMIFKGDIFKNEVPFFLPLLIAVVFLGHSECLMFFTIAVETLSLLLGSDLVHS